MSGKQRFLFNLDGHNKEPDYHTESRTIGFILGLTSIHVLCSLTPVFIAGFYRVSLASIGWMYIDNQDKTPVKCRAASKRKTIQLNCLFLDCGTKPDNPERTCTLVQTHGNSMRSPSRYLCKMALTFCCKTRVLTTALLLSLKPYIIFIGCAMFLSSCLCNTWLNQVGLKK